MYEEYTSDDLLKLYEQLISEQARKPKTFKRQKELEDVYEEVFKRVWAYEA